MSGLHDEAARFDYIPAQPNTIKLKGIPEDRLLFGLCANGSLCDFCRRNSALLEEVKRKNQFAGHTWVITSVHTSVLAWLPPQLEHFHHGQHERQNGRPSRPASGTDWLQYLRVDGRT